MADLGGYYSIQTYEFHLSPVAKESWVLTRLARGRRLEQKKLPSFKREDQGSWFVVAMQEVIRVVTCTEFGVLFPFPQKTRVFNCGIPIDLPVVSQNFRLPDVFFYQIIGRTHGTLLEVTALWRLTVFSQPCPHYCLLYALTGTGKTVRFDIGGPTPRRLWTVLFLGISVPGIPGKSSSESSRESSISTCNSGSKNAPFAPSTCSLTRSI